MASAIKQQKPGKNRGKKCNAETFVNAAQEATDKSKQIMVDIQAILQETVAVKSQQRMREQDSRGLLEISLAKSTTKAKSANSDQKHESISNNEGETGERA